MPMMLSTEDAPHVWIYHRYVADDMWSTVFTCLEHWLHTMDSNLDLIAGVLAYPPHWRMGEALVYVLPYQPTSWCLTRFLLGRDGSFKNNIGQSFSQAHV
jgi:hypothetical protein